MMLEFGQIAPPLRLYVFAVVRAGPTVAVAAAVAGPFGFGGANRLAVVLLAALALLAIHYPLPFSHRTRLDVASAAYVAMILVLPPSLPGLLALLVIATEQIVGRQDPVEALFNAGQGALSVTLAALSFDVARGVDGLGPDLGVWAAWAR